MTEIWWLSFLWIYEYKNVNVKENSCQVVYFVKTTATFLLIKNLKIERISRFKLLESKIRLDY